MLPELSRDPLFKIGSLALKHPQLGLQPLSRGGLLQQRLLLQQSRLSAEHHPRLEQMDPTLAGHCMQMAAKVGKAMIAAVGAVAWNVLQNNGEEAGQVVHHVHFHIIPRGAGDGLGFRWPAGKLDQDEAANLVKAIGALIGNQ